MKSLQLIAHTTGGEVRSAVEQVTEREYETVKEGLKDIAQSAYIEFDTDNGWVIIPTAQIFYIEVRVS